MVATVIYVGSQARLTALLEDNLSALYSVTANTLCLSLYCDYFKEKKTMPATRKTLILYSTPACHLCETAHELIKPFLSQLEMDIEEVDISESDALIERFGVRIPVIKFEDGEKELGWPFSAENFLAFVSDQV
ncbi:MAG: glutaredoxin family protein [Gammaproteobacteria bacterium]|nr:glutaredoxin family protein [Gammaproteobacteria bacterium]